MNYWKGCNCSVCNKPLEEGDDVVFCPDCGAPYHRDCYDKAGKCVYSAKHGTGFVYTSPENKDLIQCPNCGAKNNKEHLFCENCGQPLAENSPAPSAQKAASLYAPAPSAGVNNGANGGGMPAFAIGMEQSVPKEIDGIASADWAEYIGNSAPYYLFQFQRMNESGRKTSFCWSALLFAPMYFFYRKMWSWAALSIGAFVLLGVPSILQMLIAIGMPLGFSIAANTLETIALVCAVLNWALSLFFGLYAFYLYRKSAGKKLQAMKATAKDDMMYHTALHASSGPSRLAVGCLFGAFFLAGIALSMWIGPERAMALYYYY
ncbi:MAG: RING finger protein [Ruthenibacterium sp.]